MGKIKDLTGQTFGSLTVVCATQERTKDHAVVWQCECSCGKTVYASATQLKNGWKRGCAACVRDPNDLSGRVFGHMTVLEKTDQREGGSMVWRCQCECGRVIYANTWRIKTGVIYGCEECAPSRLHMRKNVKGQVYGDLTVLKLVSSENGKESVWLCRCICGQKVHRTISQLTQDRNWCRTNHGDRHYTVDLTGQQFGQLQVLHRLNERDNRGSVMWLCRCSCGKTCSHSTYELKRGTYISCGCARRNILRDPHMREALHRVDGTCVEFLQRKMRCDNSTGHTGVYQKGDKWYASISFKGKKYYLGQYGTLEEAVAARKRGEEMHREFLEQYYYEHPEYKRIPRKAGQVSGSKAFMGTQQPVASHMR